MTTLNESSPTVDAILDGSCESNNPCIVETESYVFECENEEIATALRKQLASATSFQYRPISGVKMQRKDIIAPHTK